MKFYPHVWDKLRGIPWPWCRHCGLLWLKNEPSDRAARGKCPSHD